MANDRYGDPLRFSVQTQDHAQSVIDTAVLVWEQMGLSTAQIMYGIAMMNVESSDIPTIPSGYVPAGSGGYVLGKAKPAAQAAAAASTIRGLGQFSNGTWNYAAGQFDKTYGLTSGSILYVHQDLFNRSPTNANFNPSQPGGTNAQSGESNDPSGGQYDPQGLVEQLEVVGQGIVDEWTSAEKILDNQNATGAVSLQNLINAGVSGAPSLNESAPTSSELLATVALAYLAHHEGLGWWAPANLTNTEKDLKSGTASAIASVLAAFERQVKYLLIQPASSGALAGLTTTTVTSADLASVTPSVLLYGDPWQLAGADLAPFITNDIPSISPFPDDSLSQTAGGLSSFTATRTGSVSSFNYTSKGTGATDVVSGSATYDFASGAGLGAQTLGNGSAVTYSEQLSGSTYSLIATTKDVSGNVVSTQKDNRNVLNGYEDLSSATYDGSTLTSATLDRFNLLFQTQVQGDYNANSQLVEIEFSSAFGGPATSVTAIDPNFLQLAQENFLPTVDPYTGGSSNVFGVLSAQGDDTLNTTDGLSSVSGDADPGSEASVALSDGLTLSWEFSPEGGILSRDVVGIDGGSQDELFNASGQYVGTSVTTANGDGSAVTTKFDTSGAETGYSTETTYGPSNSLVINGVTTSYANGFTLTAQYGPPVAGGASAISSFSVSFTAMNSDGTFTGTEKDYTPQTDSDGSITDVLSGSTLTVTSADQSSSIDYDGNGNVTGSRVLTSNANGSVSIEDFDSGGVLTGSETLSIDSGGNTILDFYGSSGQLTESEGLALSGVLTGTTYSDGAVSGQEVSTVTAEGGNITTLYSASGSVSGYSWTGADGTYGLDTVQADGGSTGVAYYGDSSSTSSVNNGEGDIATTDYSSAGLVTGTTETVIASSEISSSYRSTDGTTQSTAVFNGDGSTQASVAESGGASVGMTLDPTDAFNRQQADSQGVTTAASLDGDGDFAGNTVTSEADGGVMTVDYDPTGAETGYNFASNQNGVVTTTDYADAAGQFVETGYTEEVSGGGGGAMTTTEYSVSNGVAAETGYTVSTTDAAGNTTTTSYAANPDGDGTFVVDGSVVVNVSQQGLVTKDEYDENGTLLGYVTERIDSAGDTLVSQYDSAGNLLQSSTTFAGGVVQDVLYDTDSGTVTTRWQTDGSYQQIMDDGEGDVTTTSYSATDVALSDTWTQGDQSYGSDTYNADGTSSGVTYNSDGSYSTYTQDAAGNTLTQYYSASGTLQGVDEWINDGHGDSVDLGFDASGALTGQMWVTAEGATATESLSTQGANFEETLTALNGSGESTVGSSQGGIVIGWGSQETLTAGAGPTLIDGVSSQDLIIGGAGSDTLEAFAAGTTLVGGSGSDLFEVNDPTDVVQGGKGTDSIVSSVSYSLPTNVDVLILTGTADLTATGDDDAENLISANSGDDTLIAGSGSDILVAGSGTDVLEGGSASTMYVFNADFGSAEIEPTSGSGTIQFGADISPSSLAVGLTTASNGDPALLIQDGSGSITVDSGLTGSIGTFGFADGTQLSLAGLLAAATVMSSTLTGSSGNAIIDSSPAASLSGGSGQDTIIGAGASDTLTAGTSDQYLLTAGDNAVVTGGYGDDTLVGGGANDTLLAGNGNQQLYAQGAGEVLVGGVGNDTLYGGSGSDTLIAGTGSTIMYGGASADSIVLVAGAAVTFLPSSTSATELIELPAGMTLADFTAYEGANGDLVLESLSGSTSAVFKGFYTGGSAGAVWIIADSAGRAEPLSEWLDSLEVQAPEGYEQEMDALRQSFAANLAGTLDQIGQQGGTIAAPGRTISRGPQYQYQFNGVSSQDSTVQGGVLTLGPSEDDQATNTTLQTGSTTYAVTTPVYGEVTVPGWQEFIPDSSLTQQQIESMENESSNNGQGMSVEPGTDASGNPGFVITNLPSTEYLQTGTKTTVETVPVYTTYTQESQSFATYNVTGDGGNDSISASGDFVGTVSTGNGNVSVDFGLSEIERIFGHPTFGGYPLPLGAFIEAGSGNDNITGTGGADVIAAGTGFDNIFAAAGSTVYVPLQGMSTEHIDIAGFFYGSGALPQSTLMLPAGITPEDLSYRVITGVSQPNAYLDDDTLSTPGEELEITYGDSTVLMDFGFQRSDFGDSDDHDGIDRFQFADGTVLTRDQIIALAGPAVAASAFNPTVDIFNSFIAPSAALAGAALFIGTDSSGSNITWYQISDTGTGGAHFTLGGVTQSPGQPFYVSADELSELTYVAGSAGSTDSIQVSAFDGVAWGAATSFYLEAGSGGGDQATGPNQIVTGGASGPDTLVGGYGGDTLIGKSGQDTFDYNSGGGAEKISETAPSSSTSTNVLQFGTGIRAASLSLSVIGGSELVLSVGNGGDAVSIEGFDPLNPLQLHIQSFAFADGTELSPLQLLSDSDIAGSSGNITNADGSVTSYDFTPSSGQIYSAQTTNSSGQATASISLNADGSQTSDTYIYNADGSYSDTSVSTQPGGGATTTVTDVDAQGRSTMVDITNPDGSTDDTAYSYNADGSYSETEVVASAGGGATTTVTDVDAQGQWTNVDITNPDGSTDDTTYSRSADGSSTKTEVVTPAAGGSTTTVTAFDSQGGITSVDVSYPDGSANNTSYTHNPDGSGSQTIVVTPPGGGASTTTTYASDSQGRMTSIDITNPDGSTDNSAFTYNPDGSGTQTEVVAPAGGGTTTTTVYDFNSQHFTTSIDTTNPDGSTDDLTFAYNPDGSFSQTAVETPVGGGAPTVTVTEFDNDGRETSADVTKPDGSTDDFAFTYGADGSRTQTEVATPAGGGPTTTVMEFDNQGGLVVFDTKNPDGSANDYAYASNGELIGHDITNSDGSTDDSSYSFNQDGSYVWTEVLTPASGGAPTTTVTDYNGQGQSTSIDTTNPDGSTVDSTFVYNPDGSYTETMVSTPAGGGSSTTQVYHYNADGQLEGNSYQATGENQQVVGGSTGPDILIGGYGGDTLIGSSGQDTFEYDVGSGSEVISETAPTSSGSANALQLGSGIAPASLSLSITGDPQLVLSIGSSGDSVSIEGFDPLNPLQSFTIESFVFADGASLTLFQLLADSAVTGSGGSITNADGSVTTYGFTPSAQQIYDAQTKSAGGQLLASFTLNQDGSEEADSYSYNPDGTYSQADVSTPAGGGGATTTVYGYDSSGDMVSKQVTNPDGSTAAYTYGWEGLEVTADLTGADGSTSDSTFSYNSDGTYSKITVSTPAGDGGSTTTADGYDASGNLVDQEITNPDGSLDRYTFNAQGQELTGDITNADGSTINLSFTYNADGTYSQTSVFTPASGGSTVSIFDYDASGNELSEQDSYPDGSSELDTFNIQGQRLTADYNLADGTTNEWTYTYNVDGTSSAVEVSSPTGGGGSTNTTYEYDASGNELRANITNPDGSTELDTFDVQGQLLTANYTHADGSTSDWTYTYSGDGTSSAVDVSTPAGGGDSTTTTYQYDTSGSKLSADTTNPDGSTADWTYTYNDDGTSSATEITTPAGGGGFTTTAYGYDSSGDMVSKQVTNPDGSTATYTYGWEGLEITADITNADGSTSDSTFSHNSDGTYSEITVSTPAGGGGSTTTAGGYDASGNLLQEQITNPDGSLDRYTFNTQGQELTGDITNADGSTINLSFSYNGDGTYSETKISTPAAGGSTVTVYGYDASGNEVSEQDSYPDGSSESDTFNAQGQRLTSDYTLADGSTNDWTYTYNADGTSSATEVSTPAGGGSSTTTVYQDDAQGNQLNENSHTPGSGGSYTDIWSRADGSHGSYWWNASTSEYQETWYDSNGSNWTDDYQYANGGSPGAAGYSFVETYTVSDGSQGTRQYDASTGVSTLSWDSSATGSLSGTMTDSGFIGLQNDGELTNTQQDLTFFNRNVSSSFNAFLAAH